MMKSSQSIVKFLLLIAISALASSCLKKEKDCNAELKLEGPIYVNEGSDFTLTPTNVTDIDHANTYFYWQYADMTNANFTVGGMYEVSDADPVTFENADIRHDGVYSFKIDSGNDKCPDVIVSHTVHIVPKPSPCFNNLTLDTLEIDESFTGGTILQSYTPLLIEGTFGDAFTVDLAMPMFTYNLKFHFDIPVPDYSSTYKLRNYYQNGADAQIPDDPVIQASIEFSPDNEGYNAYRIAENQQNLYVKVEGNNMYLSFCDLLFTHTSIPGRTIVMSGKLKVAL